MAQITFEVNEERVQAVSIGEILDLQDNPKDMKLQINFLAHFAVNGDGQYMTQEAAIKAIRQMNVMQLMETVNLITGQMNDVVAPKE